MLYEYQLKKSYCTFVIVLRWFYAAEGTLKSKN